MKRILILCAAMSAFSLQAKSTYSDCFNGESVTDVYTLKLKVRVPRIYDNTKSLGYRKYQWQAIVGELHITYQVNCDGEEDYSRPKIEVKNLVNKTHKMNGKNITYSCLVNNDGETEGPMTRVNVIGNNKTDVFKQASVCFYMDAKPSYSIGADDEDNSLLITLGGEGTVANCNWYPYYGYYCCGSQYRKYYQKIQVINKLKGYLSGTLGCGCKAYGHKSPTRVMGYDGHTDMVDDVAAVYGQWRATYKGRL